MDKKPHIAGAMNGTTHLRHQIQSAQGTREERPPGVMLQRWLPVVDRFIVFLQRLGNPFFTFHLLIPPNLPQFSSLSVRNSMSVSSL
jgi:hypothetical protein